MTIPRWLLFLVAAWVIGFGVFRIVIALRPRRSSLPGPNYMQRGLFARPPRTHLLFGAVYLLLGAFLVATGFGWAPVVDMAACGSDRGPTRSPDSATGIRVVPADSDSAAGK